MSTPLRILPERLVENLERARYRYAVTYQNIPHYYTVAKDWVDYRDEVSEELRWTVWEMRKHDVARPFMGREQHYLDVNGFSYWTMGPREEGRLPHQPAVLHARRLRLAVRCHCAPVR